ncbi:DNA replication factor Cdt1 isoform X2 [Cylas formicarius]|nr:DNA replication factor Cdt1 isoform X2 [Cylas formicarius]XP_060521173.1 DNA replication factor Cdt1 isoform X2 [Cylas formicarius]
MAQPSVACFFNTRKRAAVEDSKIQQARKVLVLDSTQTKSVCKNGVALEGETDIDKQDSMISSNDFVSFKQVKNAQEETKILTNKVVTNTVLKNEKQARKVLNATRKNKIKGDHKSRDIQELFSKLNKSDSISLNTQTTDMTLSSNESPEDSSYITPPSTPQKTNALDRMKLLEGPSLKEIKNRMKRSTRLNELRASLLKFQESDKKLTEIEDKTSTIGESPKLKEFKTIEIEVHTSPQKIFSPEKAYLSPKKSTTGVRKNLLNFLSPTKTSCLPLYSQSNELVQEPSKPALTLPFKYRFLAEMFRAVDTVSQILFNRKETITLRKLKPAVEEMLKRNLLEKHLAQIKSIYPDAYSFSQEKLKVFGAGLKSEQWELVLKPNFSENDHMTSELLLERRRKLYNILLDKVKGYHNEFLISLDTPINIPKDHVTRWHPEFDIEKVPDIELAVLPQPPAEDKLTTGAEVLERARVLFSCNARMEQALRKLKETKETNTTLTEEKPKFIPESVLKGIPKALLEKVRERQAAKALVTMTRSSDKEKEIQLYARLPELARLTRNVFVSEKKSVLPLEGLVEKLEKCYKGNLSRTEMEEHLRKIAHETPKWLVFHSIRNGVYVKLTKDTDLSMVVNKLESAYKLKNES